MSLKITGLVIFIMLSTTSLCADSNSYLTVIYSRDDKVEITVNELESRIINAELYRIHKGNSVNIYDFVFPDNKYSEPSVSGACYFLKIYFEDGTALETDEACYSKRELLKRINYSMISLLMIFLISLFIPVFLKRFLPEYFGSSMKMLLKFTKTFLGENTGSIFFTISTGSAGDPLCCSLTKLMDSLSKDIEEGSLIESGFSNNYAAVLTSPEKGVVEFISQTHKRNGNRQFVFNISDGSASSDLDSYMSENDARRIAVSSNVAGLSAESLFSKRSMVSVEPYLMSSLEKEMKGSESLKISGVYLFVAAIAVIVVISSVALTLAEFFPGLKQWIGG